MIKLMNSKKHVKFISMLFCRSVSAYQGAEFSQGVQVKESLNKGTIIAVLIRNKEDLAIVGSLCCGCC